LLPVIAAGYADDGNVTAVFDIADNLEERNDSRPDLVAAYTHHPFFKVLPGQARDRSVVFDAQQHHAPFQVRESNQFFRKVLRTQVIPFEFHPGILAVRYDFQ
jgi:hypothetical protein